MNVGDINYCFNAIFMATSLSAHVRLRVQPDYLCFLPMTQRRVGIWDHYFYLIGNVAISGALK